MSEEDWDHKLSIIKKVAKKTCSMVSATIDRKYKIPGL